MTDAQTNKDAAPQLQKGSLSIPFVSIWLGGSSLRSMK